MANQTNKNYFLIFTYLFFFGLSIGVWSEFGQLWLSIQNITITNISLLVAISSITTGIIIVFITKYTKKINEIIIIKIAFILKLISLLGMLFGYLFSIKFLSIIAYILDLVINNIIVLITYPVLTYIVQNDHVFGKRKLMEYVATDLGILLASAIIGRSIGSIKIDYNVLLILSILFLFGALISVLLIKNNNLFECKDKPNIKNLLKDKIKLVYLFYSFISQIAYYSSLGMLLLLILNYTSLTSSSAAFFIVIAYIVGDVFGYLALKKLTPKNDYLVIILKFGFRFLLYLFVIIFPTKEMLLIALFLSLFVSRAYENRTDGIYFNRCNKSEMFSFSNIRYSINYLGRAIGILICGLTFNLGLCFIFGISTIFILLQILIGFYLIKLRKNEEKFLIY